MEAPDLEIESHPQLTLIPVNPIDFECKHEIAHISGLTPLPFLFRLHLVAFSYRRILGETIRTYRKRAQLSQEQLAEKADLTAKYLGEVERGSVNISLDSLARIAKALRISIRDLIAQF